MPNKPAAIKALRQSKKRTLRHRLIARDLRMALKKARRTTEIKSAASQALLRKTVQLVDKAVRKKILTKNSAARTKSRLMKLWQKHA